MRMALGASHSDVLKMVIADGLKPILLGVGIGFAAALALGRVLCLTWCCCAPTVVGTTTRVDEPVPPGYSR